MAQSNFDRGAKIRRWERNLSDPTTALNQIGFLMVAESQQAFVDQGFGKTKWRPRGEVNVPGIIADFAGGRKNPPQRRFETRPALIDRGETGLKGSIAHKVENDTVIVGSNLPYAAIHQTGGESETETITTKVQEMLATFLNGRGAQYSEQLGFLLSEKLTGKRLKTSVPARPFLGITEQTIADIRDAIGVEIMETE